MNNFEIAVHGKWILAGEHSVLRNYPALVFPIKNRQIKLQYQNTPTLHANFLGLQTEEIHILFWSVLERALEILKLDRNKITGTFDIQNQILLGAGLGASAAMSVAITKWLIFKGFLANEQLNSFARQLENLFHLESSGVDIAAVSNDQPLLYQQPSSIRFFNLAWQPIWYLSYSDQISLTSNCVKKVKELLQSQPDLGLKIDHEMEQAVNDCYQALTTTKQNNLEQLANAINKAGNCFSQWGLTSGKIEQHINQLLQAGAIAAKPTGAGDGGFVLSLWQQPPAIELPFELIAI